VALLVARPHGEGQYKADEYGYHERLFPLERAAFTEHFPDINDDGINRKSDGEDYDKPNHEVFYVHLSLPSKLVTCRFYVVAGAAKQSVTSPLLNALLYLSPFRKGRLRGIFVVAPLRRPVFHVPLS
jgi:hypothetical protein